MEIRKWCLVDVHYCEGEQKQADKEKKRLERLGYELQVRDNSHKPFDFCDQYLRSDKTKISKAESEKKFSCGHTLEEHHQMADDGSRNGKKKCSGTKDALKKCNLCWYWDYKLKKCSFDSGYPDLECSQFWSIKDYQAKYHTKAYKSSFDYDISDKFPRESYLSKRWHHEH